MGGDPHESGAPEVSILIPVFDERDSLETLLDEINAGLADGGRSYEVVFVDDGSSDGSAEVLAELARRDERVSVISLRRNFGKSPALAAGLQYVRGSIVVTMDADLQDDPAMIPAFLERIDAGADLVSGWKKVRNDPLGKTFPSRIFNSLVRRFGDIELNDVNCGFKAYRIECIRLIQMYGGFHRFVPVFAHDRGFRVEELVVNHRARQFGVSKFGASRFIDGILSLTTVVFLTRFRLRPMLFFGLPGLVLSVLGIALLLYLSTIWLLGESIGTRPLLTLGVLLTLAGIQLGGLGLVGEMIVHTNLKSREIYSIRTVQGPAADLYDAETAARAQLDPSAVGAPPTPHASPGARPSSA